MKFRDRLGEFPIVSYIVACSTTWSVIRFLRQLRQGDRPRGKKSRVLDELPRLRKKEVILESGAYQREQLPPPPAHAKRKGESSSAMSRY